MNQPNVILETRRLGKTFRSGSIRNEVLSDINLKVLEGEFLAIMGTSGSGKSTLLYCLSTMDKPTEGKVLLDGENIVEFNEHKTVRLRRETFGYVFQQIHLVSTLTLFENAAVPGYMKEGRTESETIQRVDSLMERVRLSEAKYRMPSQASGGEQQRAGIVRALINEPSIVFADEPTGALNKSNTMEVLDILSDVHAQGQTIVLVTHDIQVAARADRVAYLSDQNIQAELELGAYSAEKLQERVTRLTAWLHELEW